MSKWNIECRNGSQVADGLKSPGSPGTHALIFSIANHQTWFGYYFTYSTWGPEKPRALNTYQDTLMQSQITEYTLNRLHCISCSDICWQLSSVCASGRETSSTGSCFNFRAIKILSHSVSALTLTQTTYPALQLTDFESNVQCLTKQPLSYKTNAHSQIHACTYTS